MPSRQWPPFVPIALLVFATLAWGGLFSVGKLLTSELAPMSATLARYGFALLALLVLARRELGTIARRDWPLLFALGALSSVVFNGLVFFGLRLAPAGDAVLAPATVPLMVALAGLLGWAERPHARQWAALGVALAGLAVVASATLSAGAGWARLGGDALHLGAAAAWAAYVVGAARKGGRFSPLVLTTWTALAGTLTSLPLAWHEGALTAFTRLSALGWAGVAYLSLVGSVLAFLAWSQGARMVGPGRAAAFMNLVPVWGLMASTLVLHEDMGLTQLLGVALVVGGVAAASWSSAPRRQPVTVAARG